MIEEYWKRFLIENNLPKDTKCFEAFKFGSTDKQADELLNLVLQGKKIATTSPYFEDEAYSHKGEYSIVLDSKNIPRCVIQTTRGRIMMFKDMTYDVCKLEGEDEVLETWIENHVAFLKEEYDERNLDFNFNVPIYFEEFKVVYK